MRLSAIFAIVLLLGPVASGFQAPRPAPIFVFETNELWLNLHHFLYVLGRAHVKAGDATREAVAGAPAEAERGLQTLTADEQKVWVDAVTAYSTGLSQRDAIRETPMPEVTAALGGADDAATLAGVAVDALVREMLERAAPVYRKA